MSIIDFCHSIRNSVIAITGDTDVITRFVVETSTAPDTISFEVVNVGKRILPFVMEAADFENLEASKEFVLTEVRRMVNEL